MAGACECGNGPSGSVNGGEFLEQLRTAKLLRKDPLFNVVMQLVRYHCDLPFKDAGF